MEIQKRILKCILINLSDIYLNIKNFPKSNHLIYELDLYNKVLLEKERMNYNTLKYLIKNSKYYCYPFQLSLFMIKKYDYNKAVEHIDSIIYVNNELIEKLNIKRYDQARNMANCLINYPSYLLGSYYSKSDKEFYMENFTQYYNLYNEELLREYKYLFMDRNINTVS